MRWIKRLVIVLLSICCVVALVFAAALTDPSRYTSLDLALLPCEQGDSPVFFRAVEFKQDGSPAYRNQIRDLLERLNDSPPVTDLVFFIHGWNKNPTSAEGDYQNFLCRLHASLRRVIGAQKRAGGLLVVGVFWPSTITNESREPTILMPVSYYPIRNRAAVIAENGLAPLLASLPIHQAQERNGLPVRLQLIGHSFGARMLVRALERLSSDGTLAPLLRSAGETNIALLNAAIAPEQFEWLTRAVANAKRSGSPARFTDETNSYFFNLHSFNDGANRFLFRLASVADDDPFSCAAGACGVPQYATMCVDGSGETTLKGVGVTDSIPGEAINAWNIDTSAIVFDHGDIYKGRVVSLIADLLYGAAKTTWSHQVPSRSTLSRCRKPLK